MAALAQLHTDQLAGDANAVEADQTAVQSAQAQLKADHSNIFGDLGLDSAQRHRHAHG